MRACKQIMQISLDYICINTYLYQAALYFYIFCQSHHFLQTRLDCFGKSYKAETVGNLYLKVTYVCNLFKKKKII